MMSKCYQVAGHLIRFSGERLCQAVSCMDGFHPFAIPDDGQDATVVFEEGLEVPEIRKELYPFQYEDVKSVFGKTDDGYMLVQKPDSEPPFYMWMCTNARKVYLCGNWSLRLYRFALWLGYGLLTLPYGTLAIHSSCIIYNNKAVMFLGESGTGKSTHTRLWRENIDGAFLLNDDSPMVRVEDGKVWVYGSPWSGKTPCYRNERYELQACVRLSQAPHNRIRKLPLLQAYASLHPSCAPEFAYDDGLYDDVSRTLGQMLSVVPVYHLECLPDADAARLSCQTVFS